MNISVLWEWMTETVSQKIAYCFCFIAYLNENAQGYSLILAFFVAVFGIGIQLANRKNLSQTDRLVIDNERMKKEAQKSKAERSVMQEQIKALQENK